MMSHRVIIPKTYAKHTDSHIDVDYPTETDTHLEAVNVHDRSDKYSVQSATFEYNQDGTCACTPEQLHLQQTLPHGK
jgi:hypothetical protein